MDKKKNEKRQKEFEKTSNEALSNSTEDTIWSVSKDFKLIAANKAFNSSIEKAEGKTLLPGDDVLSIEIYPEAFLASWEACYKTALQGSTFKKELYIPAFKSDAAIWLEVSFNPIYTEDTIIGIACYSRNITEGKLAAEKIKESEARLVASQSVAKVGSWETNLINLDVIWSDETCRIFGVANCLPHTTHENFLKFVHPDDKEKVDKAFAASFTSESVNSIEHRIIAADGVIKEVEERWHIAIDENGKPIRAFGTIQDITERKKTENQLVENENYLRTILANLPECVKVLNSKGELLSMNPAGLAMIEADNEQQVLGLRITDLVNKKYRIGFNRLSKEVFNGNSGSFEYEVTGLKGGHRWLETRAVPLKDAVGKIENLLGVTHDITERKKAETQIIKTTEELRQLTEHLQTVREEERQRIARELHDELGQQLTAIKMDAVWIDKQVPNDASAIKNKLKNILELLDGSHQSVRKILNELRPAMLDDNGLLEVLRWQGQQFTESTGTQLHFITNQSVITLPHEMATCIFRVYQESLTNITRYAAAKTVVSSLNIIGHCIVLTIEDHGNGFDVKMTPSKNSFGLLGMRERIFSLNGKFSLTSSPGKGTKIVVSLPYKIDNHQVFARK